MSLPFGQNAHQIAEFGPGRLGNRPRRNGWDLIGGQRLPVRPLLELPALLWAGRPKEECKLRLLVKWENGLDRGRSISIHKAHGGDGCFPEKSLLKSRSPRPFGSPIGVLRACKSCSGSSPRASTGWPERDTGASHASSQPPGGRRGRRIRGGLERTGPEGDEDAPEDRKEGSAEVTLSMASRRAMLAPSAPLPDGLSCWWLGWEVPLPGGCGKISEVGAKKDFHRWRSWKGHRKGKYKIGDWRSPHVLPEWRNTR